MEVYLYMDFAKKVKSIRTELNITQEQMARELEVSFSTINRWENGKTVPNKLAMKAFTDYCNSRINEKNQKE